MSTAPATPRRRSSRRQFVLFVVTGGVAAVINVVSRVGFSQFLRFELAVLATMPMP